MRISDYWWTIRGSAAGDTNTPDNPPSLFFHAHRSLSLRQPSVRRGKGCSSVVSLCPTDVFDKEKAATSWTHVLENTVLEYAAVQSTVSLIVNMLYRSIKPISEDVCKRRPGVLGSEMAWLQIP